ncbi:MAG: nickel-binding protein [Thermoanaerobaculia bacterium]
MGPLLVVQNPDATLDTICIYQAPDEQAIRDHAKGADLPADEIRPVRDVIVVNPD